METIQIVIEESLLRAADREVKRLRTNRSKLFRTALKEHLRRSAIKAEEDREREGYARIPETDELRAFEKVIAWPED